MKATIRNGLLAFYFCAGLAHAEAPTQLLPLEYRTQSDSQSPGIARQNSTVTIADLRKRYPNLRDDELVHAWAEATGQAVDQAAYNLGLDPIPYQKDAPAFAINSPAQENLAVRLAGESKIGALVVAIVTVALGGLLGYFLRKLIAPKQVALSPGDIGRAWMGWVMVPLCAIFLSRFFLYWEAANLVLLAVNMVILGGGAYGLGFLYGKYRFSRAHPLPNHGVSPQETPAAPDAPLAGQRIGQQAITAATTDRIDNDEKIYEDIANEIESGNVRKGLWTKLWTELDGDDGKVKLAYIKARVAQIATEQQKA